MAQKSACDYTIKEIIESHNYLVEVLQKLMDTKADVKIWALQNKIAKPVKINLNG